MIYTETEMTWAMLSGRYREFDGRVLYDVTHKWDSALGALDYAIAKIEMVFARRIRLTDKVRGALLDIIPTYYYLKPPTALRIMNSVYPPAQPRALKNYAMRPVGQAQFRVAANPEADSQGAVLCGAEWDRIERYREWTERGNVLRIGDEVFDKVGAAGMLHVGGCSPVKTRAELQRYLQLLKAVRKIITAPE